MADNSIWSDGFQSAQQYRQFRQQMDPLRSALDSGSNWPPVQQKREEAVDCSNVTIPTNEAELLCFLGMQDKNGDGMIENGVDTGYDPAVDINADGKINDLEIRFAPHYIVFNAPDGSEQYLSDYYPQVAQSFPLSVDDKSKLVSLFKERIRLITQSKDSLWAIYQISARLPRLGVDKPTLKNLFEKTTNEARKIDDHSMKAHALFTVITYMYAAGFEQTEVAPLNNEAEALVNGLTNQTEKAMTQADIAAFLLLGGQTEKAAVKFKEARSTIDQIATPADKAFALAFLASQQLKAGYQVQQAIDTFNRAMGLTYSIDEVVPSEMFGSATSQMRSRFSLQISTRSKIACLAIEGGSDRHSSDIEGVFRQALSEIVDIPILAEAKFVLTLVESDMQRGGYSQAEILTIADQAGVDTELIRGK